MVLSELSFDLLIYICEFLHPLHIIALRQTCKGCHEATSKRIVWIGALNRICHHHSLFRLSFPIADMSVLELERAATAPSRWIMLSSSKDRKANEVLPSRTTRITNSRREMSLEDLDIELAAINRVYLVPEGRYLVAASDDCLGVWDLGHVSEGAISLDEKLTRVWATSSVKRIAQFTVSLTPDGLGIRILTYASNDSVCILCVFEIYPQKETHEQAKIGELTIVQSRPRQLSVPVELANLILNEANYWPKVTSSFEPENPLVLLDRDATVCCLVTSKICDLLLDGPYIVKMICFKIVSHDQGWCSEDNFPERYMGSYTWFEAIIVRDFIQHALALGPSDEIELIRQALNHRGHEGNNKFTDCEVVTGKTPDDDKCDTWTIQRNERANGAFQQHTVVWTDEEEIIDESILIYETGRSLGRGFVRSLMKDDRIAIMARAEFPGWVNHIKSIELEIYYSA